MQLVRRSLPDKTANHCIYVAEFMASFAGQAGIDHDKAVTAGLLHDLCKRLKGTEMLAMAEQYGIIPTPLQREYPKLLHGPIAAEECRHSLAIYDDDIYEAIFWHTTGRPGLGPLGLALYFADFAEPLRPLPQAAEARAILRKDGFHAALLFVANQKLTYIRNRPGADPTTEAFLAWLHETFPGQKH